MKSVNSWNVLNQQSHSSNVRFANGKLINHSRSLCLDLMLFVRKAVCLIFWNLLLVHNCPILKKVLQPIFYKQLSSAPLNSRPMINDLTEKRLPPSISCYPISLLASLEGGKLGQCTSLGKTGVCGYIYTPPLPPPSRACPYN